MIVSAFALFTLHNRKRGQPVVMIIVMDGWMTCPVIVYSFGKNYQTICDFFFCRNSSKSLNDYIIHDKI